MLVPRAFFPGAVVHFSDIVAVGGCPKKGKACSIDLIYSGTSDCVPVYNEVTGSTMSVFW
jgi:hypothetical protein